MSDYKRPPRLTYANVVATIALFLALGGGAVYAAGKIGSSGIAKNAIKSRHIAPGAVKSSEVKDTIMAATVPVGNNCSFTAKTAGMTADFAPGNQACDVSFPRSVDNCIVGATPLHPSSDVAGQATIRKLGGAEVRVSRFDGVGGTPTAGLFAITAICP